MNWLCLFFLDVEFEICVSCFDDIFFKYINAFSEMTKGVSKLPKDPIEKTKRSDSAQRSSFKRSDSNSSKFTVCFKFRMHHLIFI